MRLVTPRVFNSDQRILLRYLLDTSTARPERVEFEKRQLVVVETYLHEEDRWRCRLLNPDAQDPLLDLPEEKLSVIPEIDPVVEQQRASIKLVKMEVAVGARVALCNLNSMAHLNGYF